MLVNFTTKYHPTMTTFGEVATTLLKMMGQSGQIPGALLAEDVPHALEQLKAGVNANPNQPLNPEATKSEQAQSVDLQHRAQPLIELLENAVENNEKVMWDH